MNKVVEEAVKINKDARMIPEELEIIYEWTRKYYKGGNSLEIGAYKGMTSYLCASAIEEFGGEGKHYIVDTFDMEIDLDEQGRHRYGEHTEEELIANMGALSKYIETVRSKSLDWKAAQLIIDKKFDYAFIDGDHRDPIVYLELMLCDNSVDHILGHDYGWKGVTLSVDRFIKEKGYRLVRPNGNYGLFEIDKSPVKYRTFRDSYN